MSIKSSNHQLKIGNVKLNINHLKVRENDSRPTLVFLHDALGSIEQWKKFPQQVVEATGLNAIIYDRRGHGGSSALTKPHGYGFMHDEALVFLPAVLHKFEVQKPILIGHSDGGSIALIYAANFKPHAIVTIAPHVLVEFQTMDGIRKTLLKRGKLVHFLEKYHQDKAETLVRSWSGTWLSPSFTRWNLKTEMSFINCDVMLIQDQKDPYGSDKQIEMMLEYLGDKLSVVQTKIGSHQPHLQESALVGSIRDFVAKERKDQIVKKCCKTKSYKREKKY